MLSETTANKKYYKNRSVVNKRRNQKDTVMQHLVIVFVLSVCYVTSQSSILEERLVFLQKPSDESYKTLLSVTWSRENENEKAVECEIFTDPQLIKKVLKSSNNEIVRTSSESESQDIINECRLISKRRRREPGLFERISTTLKNGRESHRSDKKLDSGSSSNKNKELSEKHQDYIIKKRGESSEEKDSSEEQESSEETSNGKYNGLPVIFPGTKWCGSGDLAKSFDDLGLHQDTDRCCRAHDLCNDTLAKDETKRGLTNKSPFTKLSCHCDDDFYNCLDQVNSMTSNTVGNMYFNILRRECFAEDYPLTKKCKKYKTFLKLICSEYERDTKAEKVYQWVKAKKYKKIPFPGPLTITLPF